MTGPKINPRGGMHGKVCLGDCGRITRGEKESLDDFPNTITHHIGGRCASCHRRIIGDTTKRGMVPVYTHAPLSEYTPQQTKRITAMFGKDTEIMRMLGVVK
jgi:hypothetical protein